jgi:alanine-glyoxylate transaminase/serine-glyoxylate transaminase/serine-pyruvate transaminase
MSLLMIPGPVPLSPAVQQAAAEPPLGHTQPAFMERFAQTLERMRVVWKATPAHQPFVVAGSGTLAMEMAVSNLLQEGQRAVVVDTGYFSRRMAEILARRGVQVQRLGGSPRETGMPVVDPVELQAVSGPVDAVFVTHVDTSTGVRADVQGLARAARERWPEALVVVDGVCSVGGEALDQAGWDLDVVLTASQKALSAPPGLALLVASPRALAAREALRRPVPLALDWKEWLPIHQAYEARRPSYFATPATSLVWALATALQELVEGGVDSAVARHARVARALREGFAHLGLHPVAERPDTAAHTLSALWLPQGVDKTFPTAVAARGVIVAGGLHPELTRPYVRVGHLGHVTTQPDALCRAVRAVAQALGGDEAGALAKVQSAL